MLLYAAGNASADSTISIQIYILNIFLKKSMNDFCRNFYSLVEQNLETIFYIKKLIGMQFNILIKFTK